MGEFVEMSRFYTKISKKRQKRELLDKKLSLFVYRLEGLEKLFHIFALKSLVIQDLRHFLLYFENG